VDLLRLDDGRELEFSVSGADDGPVCLFHHGTPGSAMPLEPLPATAADRGARIVAYSRAGYGASSRHRGRSVADVADDMRQLLDHLGVRRCVTFGWSGGGPHTLATAALLPDRVAAVASVAGVKPFTTLADWTAGMGESNVEEFGAAVQGPETLTPELEAGAAAMRQASLEETIAEFETIAPEVDVAAMSGPYGQGLADFMAHGVRQADGWIDDDLAFTRHWGFELSAVSAPTYVWQGSEDLMVPPAHADALAVAVSHAYLRAVPGAGHISLLMDSFGQILDALTGHL
jgi:pimeloyl-ACP methyl ester carboxylesterase